MLAYANTHARTNASTHVHPKHAHLHTTSHIHTHTTLTLTTTTTQHTHHNRGWGQSFHFSPKLPAKSWAESEAAHEARIATVLAAKPGDKILDCGCGVGGPMRTISAVSGANVVGITINEYQVQRAQRHNLKVGGCCGSGSGSGWW